MAKYVCNPIEVDAFQIIDIIKCEIDRTPNGKRDIVIKLDNDEIVQLEEGKSSRMIPNVGDYLVRTHKPDEYEYLNPKHVFEAKYTKVKQHWSDCAVHNAPALLKGECDCSGVE